MGITVHGPCGHASKQPSASLAGRGRGAASIRAMLPWTQQRMRGPLALADGSKENGSAPDSTLCCLLAPRLGRAFVIKRLPPAPCATGLECALPTRPGSPAAASLVPCRRVEEPVAMHLEKEGLQVRRETSRCRIARRSSRFVGWTAAAGAARRGTACQCGLGSESAHGPLRMRSSICQAPQPLPAVPPNVCAYVAPPCPAVHPVCLPLGQLPAAARGALPAGHPPVGHLPVRGVRQPVGGGAPAVQGERAPASCTCTPGCMPLPSSAASVAPPGLAARPRAATVHGTSGHAKTAMLRCEEPKSIHTRRCRCCPDTAGLSSKSSWHTRLQPSCSGARARSQMAAGRQPIGRQAGTACGQARGNPPWRPPIFTPPLRSSHPNAIPTQRPPPTPPPHHHHTHPHSTLHPRSSAPAPPPLPSAAQLELPAAAARVPGAHHVPAAPAHCGVGGKGHRAGAVAGLHVAG